MAKQRTLEEAKMDLIITIQAANDRLELITLLAPQIDALITEEREASEERLRQAGQRYIDNSGLN